MFTPPPPLHHSPRVSRLAPKPHPRSSFPSPQIRSAAAAKRLTLRSSDGEDFEMDEAVALESRTIRHMLEGECSAGDIIPLPNVTANILSRVIEYCKKHVQARGAEGELQAFDSDFVKVDQATLFDLILAASYLGMKGLQDLTCQTVADMIKGKTPEEVCNTFNIKNDFARDREEEEVRLALE